MPQLRYLPGVATLKLDINKCSGCGMCAIVCPHAVFSFTDNKRAFIKDIDACMECGACSLNCPTAAIKVEAGVGCASGIIYGALTGTDPCCTDCCATPSERKEQEKEPVASSCNPAETKVKNEEESDCGCGPGSCC